MKNGNGGKGRIRRSVVQINLQVLSPLLANDNALTANTLSNLFIGRVALLARVVVEYSAVGVLTQGLVSRNMYHQGDNTLANSSQHTGQQMIRQQMVIRLHIVCQQSVHPSGFNILQWFRIPFHLSSHILLNILRTANHPNGHTFRRQDMANHNTLPSRVLRDILLSSQLTVRRPKLHLHLYKSVEQEDFRIQVPPRPTLASNKVKHKPEDPRHNKIILPKLHNTEVRALVT